MSNNNNNTTNSTVGISFAGLLTILFIGLKPSGYIDWSWWWVLSPVWISLICTVFLLFGLFFLSFLIIVLKSK